MHEELKTNTAAGNNNPGMKGVPGAIVIAGALIAAALYFAGAAPTANGPTGSAAPNALIPSQNAPVAQPIVAAGDFRPVDATDHIIGATNAKVTLIEYSDLECPFCERFHPTVQRAVSEYPDDVRLVYRHFPLSIHPGARPKALAAECANEQGKFWEFIDAIFVAGASAPVGDLSKIAQTAGVANLAQWQSCLDSEKYAAKVSADEQDAQAAGGRGTPYTVVVNNDGKTGIVNGAQPYETVKATIDSLL